MDSNDKQTIIGLNFGPINGNVENQQIVYVTNQEAAKAEEQRSWSSDSDYMSTEEKINLRTPSFYDKSEYEVYHEMMDILEPYIQAHGYKIELHRIFNKANFILYCSNDNNEDYSMATGLAKIQNYTQSLRMLTLAVVYCLSLRNADYGWGMADDCRAGVEGRVYRELTSTPNEWFELLKPIRRGSDGIDSVSLIVDKKDEDTTPDTIVDLPKKILNAPKTIFIQADNGYVREIVQNAANAYCTGRPCMLAYLMTACYDHNLISDRSSYLAFVESLAAWGVVKDLSKIESISNSIGKKMRKLNIKYRDWEKVNDRKICEGIAEIFGPSVPYRY